MATMRFEITEDGDTSTTEVDITFDPSRFSLKEMVRLETALGEEQAEAFLQGGLPFTPRTLQAILWAKLATVHPEVGLEDFDLDAEALSTFRPDAEIASIA